MNILYCGDRNIEDGLLISVLSLMKQVKEPLCIYVMTMRLVLADRTYEPVTDRTIAMLNERLQNHHAMSFAKKIDVTEQFAAEMPEHNLNTRFTPFCMLRLYADEVPELPKKLLYLDNDVICRKDCTELYQQDVTDYEFAGVLDYYGRWFFHNHILRANYLNSGVLLLNMEKIRAAGLFAKCRQSCRMEKMFMPDQSALNKLAVAKKILPRRFNEQRRLHKDTVLQHFTTSFRIFPWIHTLTVKPWQIERMHTELKLHEYDDILEEYLQAKNILKKDDMRYETE